MPLKIVRVLSKKANIPIPSNIELKDRYWYTVFGGTAGAKTVLKKYGRIGGDPEHRKKKWYEWWEREGRFNRNKYFVAREITKPPRNNKLAEFVGIVMGDGSITKRRLTISLNLETDKPYSTFVINLIKELFRLKPSVYIDRKNSVISIVVSRTRLVSFCKSIGLKIGNKLKQNLDIPEWIKKNKSFKIPCIRGLMDTDGCVFNECHRINNKNYCYPRLSFASYSKQLCSSFLNTLKEFGFSPTLRNNRNVQLENLKDIMRYFRFIDTNNPHHKKRFNTFLGGVPKWS